MKKNMKEINPTIKMINSSLMNLPTPSSISYMWNWGSLLGLVLIIQILSGILLASHYNSGLVSAFSSVIHITREVNYGWELRYAHMNGASLFFLVVFIHISRGMIFSSFKLMETWFSGTIILFVMMGTAFLGYVLPWGQMSFWGATVITNLLSAVPYVGNSIVNWLWGGFSVSEPTLNRFFTLHFLFPFILIMMVVIHLMMLHITGSNNPQGTNSNKDKVKFALFFSNKDLITIIGLVFIIFYLMNLTPFDYGDPENFNPANPLNTPIHIQPEWYFLFAYAILRSIPSKLGGVIALVMSIMIIMTLPMKTHMKNSNKFNPANKKTFWMMSSCFVLLTWSGANPVEEPYEMISQFISSMYFFTFMYMCFKMNLSWK